MKQLIVIIALLVPMAGCVTADVGNDFDSDTHRHYAEWVLDDHYSDGYRRIIKVQEVTQYRPMERDYSWRITHYINGSKDRPGDVLEFITDRGQTTLKAAEKHETKYPDYFKGEYVFPVDKSVIAKIAEGSRLEIACGDTRYSITPEGYERLKGIKNWIYYR